MKAESHAALRTHQAPVRTYTYTGGESSQKSDPLILSDEDVRWSLDSEEAEAQLVGSKGTLNRVQGWPKGKRKSIASGVGRLVSCARALLPLRVRGRVTSPFAALSH